MKKLKVLKEKDLKKYREKFLEEEPCDHIINPVVDHDHKNGFVRQVIDREINQFIGKCEQNFIRFVRWKFPEQSLPDLLRDIADYLEEDYSENPLHPAFVRQQIKRFGRLSLKVQEEILKEQSIQAGKSKKENIKLYRDWFFNEANLYEV